MLLETLTALTYLDMTKADFHPTYDKILTSFTAWPGLRVLKIRRCTLFDHNTHVDLGNVRELHAGCPVLTCLEGSTLQQRFDTNCVCKTCAFMLSSQGQHAAQELVVSVNIAGQSCPQPKVVEVFSYLPTIFPRLQSLRISGAYLIGDAESYISFFESWCLIHLRGMHIQRIGCPSLELQQLTSLVSLGLWYIDHDCGSSNIKLPGSLQAVTLVGAGCFNKGFQHNLHGLPCLSTVTLYILDYSRDSLQQRMIVPDLPSCVTYLRLEGDMQYTSLHWVGLKDCVNVQHLILGRYFSLQEELRHWTASLRHLLVFEHDYAEPIEGLSARSTAGAGGTRLPTAEWTPHWLDSRHVDPRL